MTTRYDQLEESVSDSSRFLCAVCKRPTLMCCSACKAVFYCSEAHQIQHWESHLPECDISEPPSADLSNITPLSETEISKFDLEAGPENSFFADEEVYTGRYRIRKDMITSICQGNPANAVAKGRSYFNRVISEYERNRYFDIYDLLTDGIILTKAYIQSGELNQARQILLQISAKMASHSGSHEVIPVSSFRPDEGKGEKLNLTYTQLKTKVSVYSTLANLLCACGDYINAEKMYVQYIKLIELHLGRSSLETSNAYFMLGLFYQNQKLISKSIMSFTVSHEIRIENLGDSHETVADCEYNLALLNKMKGNMFKATTLLQKALNTRIKNCSESSLPVAQVLEALGSIHIKNKDYKSALDKLSHCYNIRKNLLKHCPDHEDLNRVTELLTLLHDLLDEEAAKERHKRAEMSLINPIFTPETSPAKNQDPMMNVGFSIENNMKRVPLSSEASSARIQSSAHSQQSSTQFDKGRMMSMESSAKFQSSDVSPRNEDSFNWYDKKEDSRMLGSEESPTSSMMINYYSRSPVSNPPPPPPPLPNKIPANIPPPPPLPKKA
ncbi:unnamed protein product [Blepharisma stoltei]|uniref:MYND-type domain-containing protein n=1 Tax=Blepharisma stoltei TaxID=1481888 RepID=A0AAU9IML8_9CILI|nr:unnamed protein product [Blepharisma stoltei]